MKSLIWILAGSAVAAPLASDSGTGVVDIPAIETQPPRGTEPGAATPLVTSATTGITTHGPYSGTPTTTGAEQFPSTLAATIPIQPNPTATYYNANGKLTEPMPMPNLHVVNQANPNRINANTTQAWEVFGNRTGDPSNSTIPEAESCIHNNVTGYNCGPAISRDKYDPLTFPGRRVNLTWDEPGRAVGPNNSYVTSTMAGQPSFVAWLSQLNLTYTPLTVTGQNQGYTYQPASEVFETVPALNGTAFIAITDTDMFVTPFNLTILNPHIRALGLFQAG